MVTAWTKVLVVRSAEQRMGFDVWNSKGIAVCDCQKGRISLAMLWSRWQERRKAIKNLCCSPSVWWSDGVPEQHTHLPLSGHFSSHGSRWYQSSPCPLSYRLPVAKGKEGVGEGTRVCAPAAVPRCGHGRQAGLAQLAHSSCEDVATQVSCGATSHSELRGLL